MKESEVFFLYNTVKLFNMFRRAKDKYLPYLTADLFFFLCVGIIQQTLKSTAVF